MQNRGKRKDCAVHVIHYFMRINLTTFSSQIWDETFQRVTNEQDIYEGLSSRIEMYHSDVYLFHVLYCDALVLMLFATDFSPASWPDAAETGELLPNHDHQTDQPVHPVHCQSQRETRAQVLYSEDILSICRHIGWQMTVIGGKMEALVASKVALIWSTTPWSVVVYV